VTYPFASHMPACDERWLCSEATSHNGQYQENSQNYLTSSNPDPDALSWHSFWHIIWKYMWHTYSDILSGILSDICSDILSGRNFDTLSCTLSGILSGMCSGPGVPCIRSSGWQGWHQALETLTWVGNWEQIQNDDPTKGLRFKMNYFIQNGW